MLPTVFSNFTPRALFLPPTSLRRVNSSPVKQLIYRTQAQRFKARGAVPFLYVGLSCGETPEK